jgi:hypothetical protein
MMPSLEDASGLESRPPTIEDLVRLCRDLNSAGAQYIVIGGMAMIRAGFLRATEGIDLLVEGSSTNQEKVREALSKLPDNAVKELNPDDLDRYVVVRVADEIVVDLLKSACGIEYADARSGIVTARVSDVDIPFAGPELLWKLKQSLREKDRQDLMFLKILLGKE